MIKSKYKFNKILLKISGELLHANEEVSSNLGKFLDSIKKLSDNGMKIGIVIGGGNILRGADSLKIKNRVSADHIGMLATMINGLTLKEYLENLGIKAKVFSVVKCDKIVEEYIFPRVMKYIENGYVTIFVGGTSNPYFSTDTAAVLKAVEIKADILLKATKVNGVFDKDPIKNKMAKKLDKISYSDYLIKDLKVMDQTAVTLAKENNLLINVFDFYEKDSLLKAVNGEKIGSLIIKD
jgi:uridylate kinase